MAFRAEVSLIEKNSKFQFKIRVRGSIREELWTVAYIQPKLAKTAGDLRKLISVSGGACAERLNELGEFPEPSKAANLCEELFVEIMADIATGKEKVFSVGRNGMVAQKGTKAIASEYF